MNDAAESLKSLQMNPEGREPEKPTPAFGELETMDVDEEPVGNPELPEIAYIGTSGREHFHRQAKKGPAKEDSLGLELSAKAAGKRKRSAAQESEEERKPVIGVGVRNQIPADEPNTVRCIRCVKRDRECHDQANEVTRGSKQATACYECAIKKQKCEWPTIRGAAPGHDSDADEDDDDELKDDDEKSKPPPKKKVKAAASKPKSASRAPSKPRSKKTPKPKSAEYVHSTDDDSDPEILALQRQIRAAREAAAEKKKLERDRQVREEAARVKLEREREEELERTDRAHQERRAAQVQFREPRANAAGEFSMQTGSTVC